MNTVFVKIGLAFAENLRPRQWTKNLLLFAGVIFARKLGDPACLTRAFLGAVVFCFASGVVYVFNDIADRHLDQRHPNKRHRPVASGRLPVPIAIRLGLGLFLLVLVASYLLGSAFLAGVSAFFLWNWLYTRYLKQVPILDVTGIGMSFVIRATSGVLVLLPASPGVNISPWLLLCTFFLSMFLGFAKRRDELLRIQPEQGETRPVLRMYSEPMVDALIGISLAMTSVMYAMYTIWPATVAHFGTRDLLYTIPLVLAGLGRYTYLVYKEAKGGKPHEILLNDFALQVIVVGWVGAAIYIIGV